MSYKDGTCIRLRMTEGRSARTRDVDNHGSGSLGASCLGLDVLRRLVLSLTIRYED